VSRGDENRIVMPRPIPKLPGAYQFTCLETSQIYVGESTYLHNRLRDYENAGWSEERPASTDRRVQGWIVKCLDRGFVVQVATCTSAYLQTNEGENRKLELSRDYHRRLLEALAIASQPNMKLMNR
jgi:hypothetical protein